MSLSAALIQTCASDDPPENLAALLPLLREAGAAGARLVLTPEVTNCVSASRARQAEVLQTESDDATLASLRAEAAALGIWLVIGSLALKDAQVAGRLVNRCFVIAPDGQIAARYDKIHMFDVSVSDTETYRESAAFSPGAKAVCVEAARTRLGLSICYDLRFAYLYRALARSGAEILTVPSAFSPVTGAAHWDTLLRARAIETGCFVLAPAQTGQHTASTGRARQTYGHSMAIGPWGEVLLDMGESPGVGLVDLDLSQVRSARSRIPALTHDRRFTGP